MLYVIEGTRDEEPFNPSTIIMGLPLGKAQQAGTLGYWPSYYFLTPHQRSAYIDWLVGGRSAPDIDLGYVFLTFYGLEWRALVDGENRSEISREILRLYVTYGRNHSFHEYALNLLGALLLTSGRVKSLDPILAACAAHAETHGGLPPLLLDGLVSHYLGQSLPAQWARQIATASNAFKKGVAHERHGERFDVVFAELFAQRYPTGMPIPTVKEFVSVPYGWALRGSPRPDLTISTTGLVIGPSGKRKDLATGPLWDDLRELWKQATRLVLAEQRSHRSATTNESREASVALIPVAIAPGAGSSTVRTGEALPSRSAAASDPIESWYADRADEAGIAKSALGDLYALRMGEAPAMLTPTQQTRLAEALDELGLAIEPDLRPNYRRAAKEEIRYIFRVDQAKQPLVRCQQMRPLIEAAVAIASSDGVVDDAEIEEIVGHLDQKNTLSELEHRRLRLFAAWLIETKQIDLGFNRLKHAKLPKTHRTAIAALGIAIILRDGKVTDSERKAILRLYKALELPETDLDALLKPPTQAKPGVVIDWNAVAKLQAETHEVQGMLAQVLTQEDEEAEKATESSLARTPMVDSAVTQVNSMASSTAAPLATTLKSNVYPGLDPRAAKVLVGLAAQTEISTADFKVLCSSGGLLPSAAIDLINEWTDTNLGDRCIDGDGPYQIASHLLATKA